MPRTFPTAGVSPIDVYTTGVGARSNGYFERYLDSGSGGTNFNNVEVRNQCNATLSGTLCGLFVRSQVDTSGDLGNEYGIWVEMRAPNASSTVGNQYAMSIRAAGSTVPGYQALFRLYNSVAAAATAVDSVFHLANSGGTPFTYLFDFEGGVAPISAYTSGTTVGYRIDCQIGATTYYLHLYTT